jgi:bifunctional enzyme CysN/CysC
VSSPYEVPENPELRLKGGNRSPEEMADEVIRYLEERGRLAGD